jgi:serine/threonine protein phosphatase 1
MTVYAIGDVHGQYDMLRAAHDRIETDRARHGTPDAPVIHLGDLPDRGPNTKAVIQHLIDGIAAGQPWVVLKGNHDRMFSTYLTDWRREDPRLRAELHWRHPRLGGMATLASYGVDADMARDQPEVHREALAAVAPVHRAFLDNRPLTHLTDDLLFVHAGIRPGVPLDQQHENDLVWIRDEFLPDRRDHGRLVVHGHTVVETPEHAGNRVNLDSGAGYGHPLTAAVFEGRDVWVLTDAGRVPLRP